MVHPKLNGGYIFDIQGFSVHDGPGCRTLIFLKGCLLNCEWCSNPEGINPFPEPLYNVTKCILDNLCLDACRQKAITIAENKLDINRELCIDCSTYDCAGACCTSALKIGGYFITTDQLYERIRRDRHYWGSNGGITLTGGEPFFQPAFSTEILKKCYDAHIHTAVETCGNVPWESIENALPYLDWIFYDLKQMESERHKSAIGADNSLIMENAMKLAAGFQGTLIFRMPVIPGYNDNDDHISTMAAFIRSTGKDLVNILPVHHFGREKYNLTGKTYYISDFLTPTAENLKHIQSVFAANRVTCYIGSETPF